MDHLHRARGSLKVKHPRQENYWKETSTIMIESAKGLRVWIKQVHSRSDKNFWELEASYDARSLSRKKSFVDSTLELIMEFQKTRKRPRRSLIRSAKSQTSLNDSSTYSQCLRTDFTVYFSLKVFEKFWKFFRLIRVIVSIPFHHSQKLSWDKKKKKSNYDVTVTVLIAPICRISMTQTPMTYIHDG